MIQKQREWTLWVVIGFLLVLMAYTACTKTQKHSRANVQGPPAIQLEWTDYPFRDRNVG